ncbi:dTDP-4-dehydrorhamnose reductase [Limibacillus sp. MBR-115]
MTGVLRIPRVKGCPAVSERPKILVLGVQGQLASALRPLLAGQSDRRAIFLGRPELDVADSVRLRAEILAHSPAVIVNATAYTAVDRAESEPAAAYAVNRDAVAVMGETAGRLGAAVVHVSTDYVFDGRATRPYRESDITNPQGVYGASKLAGEEALAASCARHVILRTAWLYGSSGSNFLRTMLRLANERDSLAVVDDQQGCPTAVRELAAAIGIIIERIFGQDAAFGLYHFCGAGGPVTWFDFASEIFCQAAGYGLPIPRLERTTTAAFGAPAPRPAYSLLDCRRIESVFGVTRNDWREALATVLAELAAAQAGPAAGLDISKETLG